MSLYDRLKGQPSTNPPGRRTYSFQDKTQTHAATAPTRTVGNQSAGRFRARTGEKQPAAFSPPTVRAKNHFDDTDRPYAYDPPVFYVEEGLEVYHPSTRDKFIDLGLRIVEAMVPAIAGAIYHEIAHYFSKRRFYKHRRD